MDSLEGLSPTEATKVLYNAYEPWELKLAERRFWEDVSIINGKTRKVRVEYLDIPTGRKVAAAVLLLEIIHHRQIRWNKAEVKMLFNKQSKTWSRKK